jgi:hypothetical protein
MLKTKVVEMWAILQRTACISLWWSCVLKVEFSGRCGFFVGPSWFDILDDPKIVPIYSVLNWD